MDVLVLERGAAHAPDAFPGTPHGAAGNFRNPASRSSGLFDFKDR